MQTNFQGPPSQFFLWSKRNDAGCAFGSFLHRLNAYDLDSLHQHACLLSTARYHPWQYSPFTPKKHKSILAGIAGETFVALLFLIMSLPVASLLSRMMTTEYFGYSIQKQARHASWEFCLPLYVKRACRLSQPTRFGRFALVYRQFLKWRTSVVKMPRTTKEGMRIHTATSSYNFDVKRDIP